MKQKILIGVIVLTLSGCMQSREQLVIQKDGSGTMESDLVVPAATVELINTTLGGFMAQFPDADQDAEPESMAQKMFANKEELLKKIEAAGGGIEVADYTSEEKEGGLHVHYNVKFDDINELLKSGIVGTKMMLRQDPQGQWVCILENDDQKAEESQEQAEQFKNFKDSEDFKNMPPGMQEGVMLAIKQFEVEFLITLPTPIKELTGIFEKAGPSTARLYFSGDFLEDPSVLEKLYGVNDEPSRVVWEAGDMAAAQPGAMAEDGPAARAEMAEQAPAETMSEPAAPGPRSEPMTEQGLSPLPEGKKAKLILTSGETVEGELIERTDEHVKIKVMGVPLTYYEDEIKSIEPYD